MRRILAAAAQNPVFANLLMVSLIVGGVATLFSMTREMFPEMSFDRVVVSVPYPGATPEEIEEGIAIKVEEAVRALDGVHKIESISTEGMATVTVEVDSARRDPRDVMVDITNELARITTFPDDVEEPQTRLIMNRREVMILTLAGAIDEASLAQLARELEEELLLLPDVSQVDVDGLRRYELAALVREDDLQRYGLSFADVSRAVADANLDLPLGTMRTADEEALLRVQRLRKRGRELAAIPVVSRPDGARVRLGQVAQIRDGFVEDERRVELDGKRAAKLTVWRTGDQDTIRLARTIRKFVEQRRASLPAGVELVVWRDFSEAVVDRLGLLTRNGSQGLLLVFAILLIFLGTRLSFWVAAGLPVAFLAAMVFLDAFGGTLNMISSFALIMILGILVDDSIVVAENIARRMREDGYSVASAVAGLQEVTWPVIASVTTTAVAFMPLFFIEGIMGKFIRIMPVAVIACLLASLVEALLILPAHLAHGHAPAARRTGLARLRERIDGWTEGFIANRYGPSVDWALRNRYVVLTAGFGFLIVVLGVAASGRPAFTFFPRLDAEFVQGRFTLPQGTPFAGTEPRVERLAAAAAKLREELPPALDGSAVIRGIVADIGGGGVHKGSVELQLAPSELREITSREIEQRWRELAGPFPGVRSLSFEGRTHRPGGRPLELRILTNDGEAGAACAAEVEGALAGFPGVFNVENNLEPGKRELRFAPRPAAEALGVTARSLARQLFAGFRGDEVQTLQRGRDEVEVRVRYAPGQRARQDQLGNLRLRTSAGVIPLETVATVERGRSLSRIERRDGRRVVKVTGDVDDGVTNANRVVEKLKESLIPGLEGRFPGVEFAFGGQQEEQADTMRSLGIGFLLALLGIYAILALLFGSYIQPLVVMMVVPVGFAGAILGHLAFGLSLTIFSVFGMVGLTGIVVNDSLVLIDFVNRLRAGGKTAWTAAAEAGRVRFRAVFLTTVTTVAGLLPILLEESLSAQFVIPMAVSIASGVAAATFLTLYVVPCAYLVIEDIRAVFVVTEPAAAPAVARGAAAADTPGYDGPELGVEPARG